MRESDALISKIGRPRIGYWRKYRAEHSTYAERNRTQQQMRNQARIAKDAPLSPNPLPSGVYRLIPVTPEMIARMLRGSSKSRYCKDLPTSKRRIANESVMFEALIPLVSVPVTNNQ